MEDFAVVVDDFAIVVVAWLIYCFPDKMQFVFIQTVGVKWDRIKLSAVLSEQILFKYFNFSVRLVASDRMTRTASEFDWMTRPARDTRKLVAHRQPDYLERRRKLITSSILLN